jgi:deoxycytidylate deaminase
MEITCKDKKVLVSYDHYDLLKDYKININKSGYPCMFINNKLWLIHRYIIIEILKQTITEGYVIDHINNNKLDNRKENLRLITRSDNSRNRSKKNNATSKYYGVFYHKEKKWRASIVHNNKQIVATYDNEIHAAYQYDLWVSRYNLTASKSNNIEKPLHFIEYEMKKDTKKYPKGINKHGKKFRITISLVGRIKKHVDSSNNLDNAIKILKDTNITKNNNELLIQELKVKFNKVKNNDGNYVFIVKNRHIIIDKDIYPLMYKHTWFIDKNYVKTNNQLLSRMIMNCSNFNDNLIVDHINGNTLDNRRCNLRLITQTQNALNQSSSKNSSSEYIGVYYNKKNKKWTATIGIDGKSTYLGTFNREQDAALARDYATKKYYKEFGRLNFPERPGWNEYFMNICEAVKLRSPDYYKVGSVLVSIKNNRIISTGYNSIASRINDDIDWSQRDFISDIVIHAEMNVLLYCESKFEDSVLYTTSSPCANCLKMLSASKIKKIIYKYEYKDIDKVKKLAEFLNIQLIEYENIR